MEGLKKLEDEQRKFFETGAKISLVEEKEKSSKQRVEDLTKEKEKIKNNIAELNSSENSATAEENLSPELEKLQINANKEAKSLSLDDSTEKKVTQSLSNFWIDGYKTGVGEANDNILTINSLKKDFEERIVAIENEIKALEKDTTTEKANLSDLIELRKTQELAVIELRGNQDKSSEGN